MSDLPRLPAKLQWSEERDGDAWRFRTAPDRRPALWLLLLAAAWHGVPSLVVIRGGLPLLILGLSAHFAVGAVITWSALAGLLNHVTLELDAAGLRLRQAPLPRPGALTLPLQSVERFAGDGALETVIAAGRRIGILASDEHAVYLAARLNRALEALRTPKTYRG